jgi:NAD(P)-dependent dehydrogenase (short-subunit alcohol dehydrogenase family)
MLPAKRWKGEAMAARKVVLVTGGGRGIGAAVVRLAAARGFDVAFTYAGNAARAAETEDAARAAGAAALAMQADVADGQAVAAMFAAVDARFGRLDALVNNAGITGPKATLRESTDAAWDQVFRTNVLGLAACCRQALARLPQGGAIVNVSSRAAALGGGGEWIHYAASKGAVDTLTIGLAKEAAAQGVRVNAVNPGLIDTELHAAAGMPDRVERMASAVPLARGGSAAEVAEAVLWLLSEGASYVTGALVPVSGGR